MARRIILALVFGVGAGIVGFLALTAALSATHTINYIPGAIILGCSIVIGFYGLILALDIGFNW